MAKFYQPQTTKGFYSAADNRLTVHMGDRVLIGFLAASPQEMDAVSVTLSDMSALLGNYAESRLDRHYEIDATHPGRYTMTATRDGVNVIPPLEIVVRLWDFRTVSPFGQPDPTACWAACLVWWQGALAVVGANRVPVRFPDVLLSFAGSWSPNGTINYAPLRAAIQGHNSNYQMHTELISPRQLESRLGAWPLMIAFQTPSGTGHMNVLWAYNDTTGNVQAMEPWFPNLPMAVATDPQGRPQYYFDSPDQPTGSHVTRPLTYYKTPPRGTPYLFIGCPQEYLHTKSR